MLTERERLEFEALLCEQLARSFWTGPSVAEQLRHQATELRRRAALSDPQEKP